jgi:NAD(P)-dependent dehydrogenase (short-subunit alcohol dehydrogenase family)
VRALPIPTDVADPAAVEAAADRAEAELGPIDVWVNVAMATVFSPVAKLTAEEVERGTKVTYLGQVHGMMSALKRMRVRNRGTIVNVGSALAYRSVPLQSIYCGAKGDCQESCVWGHSETAGGELWRSRRIPWISFFQDVTPSRFSRRTVC